ncbi:protein kinase [Coxiella burnetii]|nr:protein kinase family [Coxiella burnetii CbuG_Q212]OYK86627.1 protein kinase [Coxiella burnetii]
MKKSARPILSSALEQAVNELKIDTRFLALPHYLNRDEEQPASFSAFAEDGDLGTYWKNVNVENLAALRFYPRRADIQILFGQLVLGVETLHKNKLVHRDLKPFNILVYPGGHLHISDLDEVTKVEVNEKGKNKIHGLIGTRGYWPKEIRNLPTWALFNYFENTDLFYIDCYALALTLRALIFPAFLNLDYDFHHITPEEYERKLNRRYEPYEQGPQFRIVKRLISDIENKRITSIDQIKENEFFGDTPEERASFFKELKKVYSPVMDRNDYSRAHYLPDDPFMVLPAEIQSVVFEAEHLDVKLTGGIKTAESIAPIFNNYIEVLAKINIAIQKNLNNEYFEFLVSLRRECADQISHFIEDLESENILILPDLIEKLYSDHDNEAENYSELMQKIDYFLSNESDRINCYYLSRLKRMLSLDVLIMSDQEKHAPLLDDFNAFDQSHSNEEKNQKAVAILEKMNQIKEPNEAEKNLKTTFEQEINLKIKKQTFEQLKDKVEYLKKLKSLKDATGYPQFKILTSTVRMGLGNPILIFSKSDCSLLMYLETRLLKKNDSVALGKLEKILDALYVYLYDPSPEKYSELKSTLQLRRVHSQRQSRGEEWLNGLERQNPNLPGMKAA